jgi:ACR3 family arsenite efflux pump ArsB
MLRFGALRNFRSAFNEAIVLLIFAKFLYMLYAMMASIDFEELRREIRRSCSNTISTYDITSLPEVATGSCPR